MISREGPKMPLVLLGAGGHAKVLLSLLKACGYDVLGVCDPGLAQAGIGSWRGLSVLGADEVLDRYRPDEIELVNGIGQVIGTQLRRQVYEGARCKGFRFPSLVHPAAWLDESVVLGDGVQVMAGAVLQPDVIVGSGTIINTRVSVDHDSRLGAHVHVAPGATLCGNVDVASGAFIGSGSTVIQGISIGEGAVVGAGTVVVRNVAPRTTLRGPSAHQRPASNPGI